MFTLRNTMIFNLIMGACLALLATACSDDDNKDFDVVTERAAKVNIGFSRYFDANGTSTQLKWNSGDQAVLRLASDGSSYMASPIRPGQTSSLFLFTVKSLGAATVVSYWPTDAPVTVGNGEIGIEIPAIQDGTVSPLLIGADSQAISSYEGCDITLRQFPALMMVSIGRGNYTVESIDVRGNAGEKLAGHISIDAATWAFSADAETAHVDLATPVSCALDGTTIAVQVAPVTLTEGYTVTVNTTDGHSFNVTSSSPVILESGEIFITNSASDTEPSHLLIGGSDKVHIVNVAQCMGADYKAGLEWTWEAEDAADILGIAKSRCDHIDDCKPVDNGSKILVSSSYNWCVLLDKASKQVLFHALDCANAHSAELLPGNRIAVACSDGTTSNHNQVRLYDAARSNVLLDSSPLVSAHGVTWCESTQRLYAVGNRQINVYSLQDVDTSAPKLKLEKSITTPQGSNHDISLADPTTLVVAGVRAYLFDVNTESFTEMPHFAASTQLKSVNYNPLTSELWYTDATVPEGTQSWSTHTLRYATDPAATSMAGSIRITDMDVYKVRVLNW